MNSQMVRPAQFIAVAVLFTTVQSFGLSKEYVDAANQRLQEASSLIGSVSYETSQSSYFPAGIIVSDLGGGKKQLKLKQMPGSLVEGYQEGPETSASVVMSGKSIMSLKPNEVVVVNDFGQDRKITYSFDGKMMTEEIRSKSTGGVERKSSRSWPAQSFSESAPVPAMVVNLAASQLDGVKTQEEGGRLILTESFNGMPGRERVIDAANGQVLNVRVFGEAGKALEETTFTGTTLVKGLALPTAIRFAWFTPDGEHNRVLEITDIKYELK